MLLFYEELPDESDRQEQNERIQAKRKKFQWHASKREGLKRALIASFEEEFDTTPWKSASKEGTMGDADKYPAGFVKEGTGDAPCQEME